MRLADDVAEIGTIEQRPQQDGRNMTMLLSPSKKQSEDESQSTDGAAGASPDA